MTPAQIIALTKGIAAQENVNEDLCTIPQDATQIPPQTDLINEREAAAILGVTPGTLQVWRSTGRYSIPFVKVGRLVKYRRSALEVWLNLRTRISGATE